MLCSLAADAGDWYGKVIRVHDGDTLTVARYGREVTVRLDEIDAPELAQAYGSESRQALVALCLGRYATISDHGEDKYGRALGRVSCAGTDANAAQVKEGNAWFYAQYSQDQALRDDESAARSRRAGLWAARSPQPPWEFRHQGDRDSEASSTFQHGSRCGAKRSCGEMRDCAEALFYLKHCGVTRLDRNKDGVPCESLCQ